MITQDMPQSFAAESLRELAEQDPVAMATWLRDTASTYAFMADSIMESEVEQLCGTHHKVVETDYQRWGTNPGTICYKNERVKVRVRRVRNIKTNKERPLETYRRLHAKRGLDYEKTCEQLLAGLSQRNYKGAVQTFCDSIGLSASTVGRAFVETSAKALEKFETRRLDKEKYAVLFIDGKCLQGVQMIVAMGVTVTGKKEVLAVVESTAEGHAQVKALLEDLIRRGFAYDGKLLVILDGAKGLRKAVYETFGNDVELQRCQWHKRENVVRHIKKKDEAQRLKARLQAAWEEETYTEARTALHTIHAELKCSCPKAAASLSEGLEETLTLHRLGIDKKLRDSLKTTNIIENLNSIITHRTRNVKRWSSSDQRHRWFAAIFLHYESRLKRIDATLMQNLAIALKGETESPESLNITSLTYALPN